MTGLAAGSLPNHLDVPLDLEHEHRAVDGPEPKRIADAGLGRIGARVELPPREIPVGVAAAPAGTEIASASGADGYSRIARTVVIPALHPDTNSPGRRCERHDIPERV